MYFFHTLYQPVPPSCRADLRIFRAIARTAHILNSVMQGCPQLHFELSPCRVQALFYCRQWYLEQCAHFVVGVATAIKQHRHQPFMLGQRSNSRAHTCLDLPLHCYIFRIALSKQAIAYCFERCVMQGYLSEYTRTLAEDNLAKPP